MRLAVPNLISLAGVAGFARSLGILDEAVGSVGIVAAGFSRLWGTG